MLVAVFSVTTSFGIRDKITHASRSISNLNLIKFAFPAKRYPVEKRNKKSFQALLKLTTPHKSTPWM
ncbi:hypothetical protein NQ315_011909 [Exocentrus adspersus]|uniref:Uncharacterized protein n=1 Tax=Exocentrus adspersus TaxID=1586481 RepID=A0AAV8W0T4_9CUCU|nr:hypothetical protein NQ315_011909 [Exocentrus adspersus]